MKIKIKEYLSLRPEILFIVSMMFYWYLTAIENFLPPLFMIMLIGGIYVGKNLLTTIISAIFLLFSAYFVWAIIGYTNKFNGKIDVSTSIGWAVYFVMNVVISFVLLFKYLFRYESEKDKQSWNTMHS